MKTEILEKGHSGKLSGSENDKEISSEDFNITDLNV